jgi:[phosphatase 2A protein]-leucine-carboxy methyltransferase
MMLMSRGTFGQVMKRNLAVSPHSFLPASLECKTYIQARNLSLPGAIYPTPLAQAARFKGFTNGGKDLWDIRETVIDPEELRRISRLEHLDEIEELRLVLGHYCVAWGGRGCLAGMGL